MADANKYLSFSGLQSYDEKIKEWTKNLDEPIDIQFVTNNTVGALKAGTSIPSTETLANLLYKMLLSVKDATLGNKPSCKITNTGTEAGKKYEVGTTINTTLTGSYTDGKFNSYKTGSNTETETINAGCSGTGPTFKKGGEEYSDGSFILNSGANTITATYSYTASTVKAKKSDGSDSDIKHEAGTCSDSLTWTGYYNYYEGAVDTLPDTIDRTWAMEKLKCGEYTSKYDTTMNKPYYAILIPENKTIVVKDNNTNADLSGTMKKSEVTIADAAGRNVNYYMYTCSFDSATGLESNKITITFK